MLREVQVNIFRTSWTFAAIVSMLWFVIASAIAIWTIADSVSDLGDTAKLLVFVGAISWSSVAGHFFSLGVSLLDDL